METQIHQLTQVQSHRWVLVFVAMQGGLSPAAQTRVHTGAEARRMELCGPGAFLSISELLALREVELQSSSKCPEQQGWQQGLSAASPNSFKHHPSSHHLSKNWHFTEVFIPSPAVSFEAQPARAASPSQSHS